MPVIKVKHVASFSSEDKNHPAENLLKEDTYRKWKCANAGEKQASVVLQLEKACQIHGLDIGNEGAAFVEVLVGRSDGNQDFQVLLVSSSFMTPAESKSGSNINRVRIFGPDKLSQPMCLEKWDRVKVVCTQPFSKTLQFGLAFIKFHSPPEANQDRNASASPLKQRLLPKPHVPEKKKAVPPKKLETVKMSQSPRNQTIESRKASPLPSPSPSPYAATVSSAKRSKSETEKDSPAAKMGKALSSVVFTLSGFQNPFRTQLRDQALSLGAKYRPDWDSLCTHLVCAFPQTPKFIQVQLAGGKIVSKQWVVDCYKRKKLLPWKRYKLVDPTSSDSEEEADEPAAKKRPIAAPADRPTTSTAAVSANKASNLTDGEQKEDFGEDEDTDVENGSDSSGDTEDEINRVLESDAGQNGNHKPVNGNKKVHPPDEVFGADTEEDSEEEAGKKELYDKWQGLGVPPGIPQLKDLFDQKKFFIYGEMKSEQRKRVERIVIAYNGKMEDYMGDGVSYVVTDEDWDEHFDEALKDHPSLIFVKPTWVLSCANSLKLVPIKPHTLAPSS